MTSESPEFVARHLGFCAYCQRDVKLDRRMRLVHHGYQRPGDGFIHGDCPLVGMSPYEVTAEPIAEIAVATKERLADIVRHLRDLEAGRVNKLSVVEEKYDDRTGKVTREFKTYEKGSEEVERKVYGGWQFLVRGTIAKVKSEAKAYSEELKRLNGWVEKWSPKPIRTIEEAREQERGARDVKAAERAAKKAADAAAKVARANKEDQLIQKRVATMNAIVAEANRLASLVKAGVSIQSLAKDIKKLVASVRREKWLRLYQSEMKPAHAALVTLELGSMHDYGGGIIDFRPWDGVFY